MNYTLEMQVQKVKGEEFPVEIKQVTHFPKKNNGEVVGFGRLQFLMFQILLRHKSGNIHKLVWYNAGGMPGKFKWVQPDKMEQPMLRLDGKINRNVFGKERRDLLAEPERVPGEAQIFEDHEKFAAFVERLCGKRLAAKCIGLFVDAILEATGNKKAA